MAAQSGAGDERLIIADVRFTALAARQIDVTSELDIKTRGFHQQMQQPDWRPIATGVNKRVYYSAIDHRSDHSMPATVLTRRCAPVL